MFPFHHPDAVREQTIKASVALSPMLRNTKEFLFQESNRMWLEVKVRKSLCE